MSLSDDLDRRTIDLQRVVTGLLNNELFPELRKSYKEIRLLLLDAETITSRKQLNSITAQITKIIKQYSPVGWEAMTKSFEEVAAKEAAWTASTVAKANSVALTTPASEKITSYINRSMMKLQSGKSVSAGTWAEYVAGNVASEVSAINNIVKHGYGTNGVTVNDIVKNIRQQFNGVTKRDATTLARTAVHHYASRANDLMMQDNIKVIPNKYFLATFDNATTLICMKYSSNPVYRMDDPSAPVFPLHYNERSRWVPLVKGQKHPSGMRTATGGQKGEDAEDSYNARRKRQQKNEGTDVAVKKVKYRGKRDSVAFDTSQVRSSTSIDAFYRRQPEWWVKSNLGKRRAELFMSGQYSLADFTDATGRTLRLDQLE